MKTALLTIGTEILFGQVVNTNAAFLSRELQNIGFDVMYHYTVGDNPNRLRDLLDIAFRDCDLVITTGGLGPTQDDLTKETIAEFFDQELVLYPDILELIRKTIENAGYRWTENNTKQAFFMKDSIILDNPNGTAPGFAFEKNGKMIAALPGPPNEMCPMWTNHLKKNLLEKSDGFIYYRILRLFGIGESSLETKLLPLIDGQTDPTIATYAKMGECSLRITSKRQTFEEAKSAVDDMIVSVNSVVGDLIYSYDDEDLVEVVGKLLISKNIHISAAESCTGGMFADWICSVPGISSVFDRSLVTYSYRAKEEELGVSKETLEKYTAESPEVAREMVDGLYNVTKSDICIVITGVAGPGDLSPDKPAGLAWIGIRYKGETKVVETVHRNVSRDYNRRYMTLKMLNEVYKLIK